MEWREVSSGSFINVDYEIWEYGGEHVSILRMRGPISRGHRIEFYQITLKNNPSSDYFIILDNQLGYEDDFPYDDMVMVSDMFLAAGIKRVYGAIVTTEIGYETILKLARAVAGMKTLEIYTMRVGSLPEAKDFIISRIDDTADSR
ncbi:MAG: hypothetical protein WDZ54_05365 [Sneathiella sp.]